MRKGRRVSLYVFLLLVLATECLAALIETTTLASYENWFTAGEMFAWITANRFETNDIASYCLRYVWPYWVVCSLIYLGIGVLVWWLTVIKNTRPAHYNAIGIIVFLAVPPLVNRCVIRTFR